MTFVKRLRLLAALMGLAAGTAAVGTAVWGDAGPPRAAAPRQVEPLQAATEAARSRFLGQPTLTYRLGTGETLFAWQVKPVLPAAPALPRDVLVVIDTSASQAGAPLERARQITETMAQSAGPQDRFDVWTLNLDNGDATRSLTKGFQPAAGGEVKAAMAEFALKEYGAGAVDLPAGLTRAAKSFEQRGGRQQVMLFLGDGESAASKVPLTETGRAELGTQLADKEIVFVAVPLGVKVQAENLHGLAMQTGGVVVRLEDDLVSERIKNAFSGKLNGAMAAPVLRPESVAFGPEGVELFPTRLPPLRGDRATLVMGKLKAPAEHLTATVTGRVAGQPVTVRLAEKLAAPSTDHYFLSPMVDQWRAAAGKGSPALLAADRALAMASEQYRLFRDEFTTQAVWAISADRLDHSEKLFQAALAIDPLSSEAVAGLKVVAGIRGGKVKPEAIKIGLAAGHSLARLQDPTPLPAQTPPAPGGKTESPSAPAPTAPPVATDLLGRARQVQSISEQEARGNVDDTLRRARRLQNADPDAAIQDLKQQREAVLNNDLLSPAFRQRLVQDIDAASADVALRAGDIKRRLASEFERIAQVRQRRTDLDVRQTQEEQTRARIDAFRQLMNQARFEEAQQEAQFMIQERVSRGQSVPSSAFASYRIGQAATNIRELQELKRIRENNYLLTMLQVEKSFVPYPDEPPVHFPPAAVWRSLTGNRLEKYSNTELGPDAPDSFKRLRSVIEGRTAKRVQIQDMPATLSLLLTALERQFQDEGVRFVFRNDLFGEDFKPGDAKLTTAGNLSGLPLGSFLDTVLRDVKMSYIVRPEFIEIGPNDPNYSLRYNEKATRVFNVAELVIGIPNAQSTSALIQNLQFLGQQATIFGAALQPFAGGGVNPFGQLGGIGGGIGGIGGLGGQLGGGLGQLGGGLGQLGGGNQGFQGGGAAGLMGAVGGALGGQAGQQGQLGQLGSAFSIQGNDQSQILVQLITQVVAQGEWNLRGVGGINQQQLAQLFGPPGENPDAPDVRNLNSLGYYPPARALIVRGSHRYHGTSSFNLRTRGGAMAGAGGPGLPGRGQVAQNEGGNPGGVAQAPRQPNAKEVAVALAKSGKQDPAKLWELVIGGTINKPDVIIDAADALFEMDEFNHAAEVLKASLRHGRVNGIWTHEALAIALKQNQASSAEVERASLSAIDLDPTSPELFLKAAKAESELGHDEIAVAFCQRAAGLEPNRPDAYVDALAYAGRGTEIRSDAAHWAGTNLLKRDWNRDGTDYHAEARSRVEALSAKLAQAGRGDDAASLRAAVQGDNTRDLVIQLLWQGHADLDLVVTEPTGAACSATRKRTTGGGVMVADVLEQRDDDHSEAYTAAQAFAGDYQVTVKAVTGQPIGGRARVKVTKHLGTPQETHEVYSLDVADPKGVTVSLDAGRRVDLSTVPDATTEAQKETTHADTPFAASGFSGGFGAKTGGDSATLPPLKTVTETRLAGISDGTGLRFQERLSADRKSVVMTARPVFTGPARAIAMPKIAFVPGGN